MTIQPFLQQRGLEFHIITADEAAPPIEVAILVPPQPQLAEAYAELLAAYHQTGWWPVQTEASQRPWLDGELEGPADIPANVDFFHTLIEDELSDGDEEYLEEVEFPPYSDHLQQALHKHWQTSYAPALATVPPKLKENHGLLLVSTPRPADAPGLLGWLGSVNYTYSGAAVSAILRNWENRFGAVLYKLDFDMLYLALPKLTLDEEAQKLTALEHHFFCPDNIDQGTGSFPEYVPEVTRPYWGFWWD